MEIVKLYTKRGIPILGFMLMAGWLVNCNQFYTFDRQADSAIISTQPVFSSTTVEEAFDGDGGSGFRADGTSSTPVNPHTQDPNSPVAGWPTDPVTGLPVDPVTGRPCNPLTGEPLVPNEAGDPVDPTTGLPIDPATGFPINEDEQLCDPTTGEPLPTDPVTGDPSDPSTGDPIDTDGPDIDNPTDDMPIDNETGFPVDEDGDLCDPTTGDPLPNDPTTGEPEDPTTGDPVNPLPDDGNSPTDDDPTQPPILQCTEDNEFRFLNEDGTYSECEECEVFEASTGQCLVRECDAGDEYRFINEDGTYGSCERCDVLDRTTGECDVRVSPPPAPEPEVPDDDDSSDDRPFQRNNRRESGGDGDGDPLMIDTQGQNYPDKQSFSTHWEREEYIVKGSLALTAPEKGTGFNLLGTREQIAYKDSIVEIDENAQNALYNISWIQRHNTRYQFLVMPDKNGFVSGIDQLFGDSTKGPDGNFSADGFRALAKWDGKSLDYKETSKGADGFIDKSDGIFSSLRLWHDANRDGNVDSEVEAKRELMTLEEANILSISLVMDTNFYERDKYGNEIIFKSVVSFKHDNPQNQNEVRKSIAFDVWFDYELKDNKALESVLKRIDESQ